MRQDIDRGSVTSLESRISSLESHISDLSMPELPEIEAYLHALRPRVVGALLLGVRIQSFSVLKNVERSLGSLDGSETKEASTPNTMSRYRQPVGAR